MRRPAPERSPSKGGTYTATVGPAFYVTNTGSKINLTALTDPSGISGSTITNIIKNGYTVTYDQNSPGTAASMERPAP